MDEFAFAQQLNEIAYSMRSFLASSREERKHNAQVFYCLVAVILVVMVLTGLLGYKLLVAAEEKAEIPVVEKVDTGEGRLAFDETNKRLQALTGNVMFAAGNLEEIKAALKRLEARKPETRVEIRTVYVEREKKRKKAKPKPKAEKSDTEWLPQSEVDKINALPKKPVIDIKDGEAVIYERKGGQ